MSATTFDTLKFAERLEKAGLTREQASAIAEAQKDAISEALDTTLATKSDIANLTVKISAIESKIELSRAENTHTRWMVGVVIALAAANFAKQFF